MPSLTWYRRRQRRQVKVWASASYSSSPLQEGQTRMLRRSGLRDMGSSAGGTSETLLGQRSQVSKSVSFPRGRKSSNRFSRGSRNAFLEDAHAPVAVEPSLDQLGW